MIEILWRMQELERLLTGPTMDADHKEMSDDILAANASHDYRKLVDNVEENILALEVTLQLYPSIDAAKVQDASKRVVQSMYDYCPGLKKAVMAYGMINPDFLP